MIDEINHILNCGYEIKLRYDPGSYERNFSNCVEKPEKLREAVQAIGAFMFFVCEKILKMRPLK